MPYSATGGEVTFSIPENLDKNSFYTIVLSAGNWGSTATYQATISDCKLICNGNGFVPIKNNAQSYDYIPNSSDIGHRIVACVGWRNDYYVIAQRVSDQIAITK